MTVSSGVLSSLEEIAHDLALPPHAASSLCPLLCVFNDLYACLTVAGLCVRKKEQAPHNIAIIDAEGVALLEPPLVTDSDNE
jgi:hypothetical protein